MHKYEEHMLHMNLLAKFGSHQLLLSGTSAHGYDEASCVGHLIV